MLNSIEFTSKKDILRQLDTIPLELIKRSKKSALNEWVAHNRMYKLGLFRKHTKDCDISMYESKFRKIIYWILSR